MRLLHDSCSQWQIDDPFFPCTNVQVENQNGLRLPELEKSLLIGEYLPSELLPNIGFEGWTSANGARDFREQAEKKSSKDKEIKKRLSALKGRQLKLLARLRILEEGRPLTTGVISGGKIDDHALRSQGDIDLRSKIKSSETESRPSLGNGTLANFAAGLYVRLLCVHLDLE